MSSGGDGEARIVRGSLLKLWTSPAEDRRHNHSSRDADAKQNAAPRNGCVFDSAFLCRSLAENMTYFTKKCCAKKLECTSSQLVNAHCGIEIYSHLLAAQNAGKRQINASCWHRIHIASSTQMYTAICRPHTAALMRGLNYSRVNIWRFSVSQTMYTMTKRFMCITLSCML